MAQHRQAAIAEPRRIATLASPIRQEIIDTLATLGGEASVAILAEQMGRTADGLYYHLRLLRRAGLIVERAGQAGEKRFGFADDARPRLVYRPESRANTTAVTRVAHALLQIAGRDFTHALGEVDTVTEGPYRQLWAARNKGWVSQNDLLAINRLLRRLCDLLGQARSQRRETLVSLAFVLAPVRPKPKRRRG